MKTLLLISLLIIFAGCDDTTQASPKKISSYNTNLVSVYCDKKTNVEYLIFNKYEAASMSIRVNADGTPKQCSKSAL